MTNFSTIGGLLLGVFGLLIASYGLDIQQSHSNQEFSLGVVFAASGGIIVWLGGRKQKNPMTTPYEIISQKTDSQTEPIKYKNLYDSCPVMLRTVNTNGIILECNGSYVKNFGFSKEEIIGKSIFDHVAEKSFDDMQKSFETWKKSGRVENLQIFFKRKDGTTFPGLISANQIYDVRGKLIGSNTAIRDISDIYQARKVLDEHERQTIQLEELKKVNSIKEEFYLMVAKESQIPLEPIKKYSEILININSRNLDVTQLEAITEIYDNAVKLEQLMRDITNVQKLNSGTMEFKKEQVNVDDIMTEMIESCKKMMKEKNIELVNSTNTKKTIMSDKQRLNEVFYNLIQNAVDFVPSTGGRIEIGAEEDGNSILFHVTDNGMGILEKRKDSVFKKFYQVDISFKRKYGGSGFGLVICKGIIENLGGKIWFESQEEQGTTFYFSIPK